MSAQHRPISLERMGIYTTRVRRTDSSEPFRGDSLMAARGFGVRGFDPDEVSWDRISRSVPVFAALVVGLILAWKGFYTVKPHEQAVILRFGEKHTVEGPGLHFMMPFVDKPVRVSI